MTDQIGRALSGRYRLIAPVGSGASALVYFRRRHVYEDGGVAAKLLHPALAEDEAFLRRFRAEAQAAAALNHPHIVAVYDWGEDEHEPYLITEQRAAAVCAPCSDACRRLTPSQALMIGLEAARGLEYAHTRLRAPATSSPPTCCSTTRAGCASATAARLRGAEAAWTELSRAMLGTARYAWP